MFGKFMGPEDTYVMEKHLPVEVRKAELSSKQNQKAPGATVSTRILHRAPQKSTERQ